MSIIGDALRIPGSTKGEELEALEWMARKYIKTDACEVGTEYGRSAYVIGSICKEKGANFYVLDIKDKRVSELEDIPMKFIPGDSRETHEEVPDLDFCFIDGDHTMPTVFYDILNFWEKIKPGGMLCGHDYRDPRFSTSEVKPVVDNLWKIRHVIVRGDSVWCKEK